MTKMYEPDVFEGADLDDLPESMAAGPCADTCDWCKSAARWVQGKFGLFIACSKYPKCKWTVKKTRVSATQAKLEGIVQEPTA